MTAMLLDPEVPLAAIAMALMVVVMLAVCVAGERALTRRESRDRDEGDGT